MKRFFSMMFVAAAATALFTACDLENEGEFDANFEGDEYVGTMAISMGGDAAGSPQNNVSFYFDDNTYNATVSLAEVCFTKGMPWITKQMPALNIVLSGIPSVLDGQTYAAQSVIPKMVDGQPFDNSVIKSVDDVYVTYNDLTELLEVSFDCTVSIDMSGSGHPADVTFTVDFEGYEVE